MIQPTIWRIALFAGLAALSAAPACAQLALPGAEPTAPAGAPATATKPKKAKSAAKGDKSAKTGKSVPKPASGVESIEGRPLLLNGGRGLLQVSRQGEALQIDKLSLAGEGVSDASQACVVNIVGEQPIATTNVGRPDGLSRYEVNVPACPFAIDVVDGAVLVPAQITACVFKAADCQTSPSGLWGPDGNKLEADAAAIGKQRSDAETAMAHALRALQERAVDSSDAAALVRDQVGFPAERDDTCRDYVKETAHGFCASRVTEARAALLEARRAALAGPAKAEKGVKSDKPVQHKRPKPAGAPAENPQ